MTTEEQQIAILSDKLHKLENESRRILGALRWSTRVRLMIVAGLLLFVLVFSFLFYRLYHDITERRFAEVQRIINDRPEEFTEPLTRQLIVLAEEQGPYVGRVIREQLDNDSGKYVAAFDKERDSFIRNMEDRLETRLAVVHKEVLEEHEATLRKEFPELDDDKKIQLIRDNMESIYAQVGKRYYVDFMGDRLTEIVGKLDTFPAAVSQQAGIPLGEQIASGMLELVQMMIIYSENYVPPEEEERDKSIEKRTAQPDTDAAGTEPDSEAGDADPLDDDSGSDPEEDKDDGGSVDDNDG